MGGGCISSYTGTEPGAGAGISLVFFGVFRKYLPSTMPNKSPVMNMRIENVSDAVREGMSIPVFITSIIGKELLVYAQA